ncbi:aminopeptidase P family protein [Thermoleophilia bacterium SCSIO 60948]|nr:aminopeptidase P family protein [Thermoleophilia bacterium SCSIO 60948]
MSELSSFPAIGYDRDRAAERMDAAGLGGMLLVSPENVFYSTGYTCLPSSGNPILYTLRNRLPYFSYVDADGRTTLMCWGFSAEGVDFGADRLVGFNNFAEAIESLGDVVGRAERNGRPLGLESTAPRFVSDLVSDLDVPAGDADPVIDELRLIKTQPEIELLKRSTEIIESCVDDLYPVLEIGLRRDELMRIARTMLFERGATGISHLTFTFGGSNPEIEIAEPLPEGRLVTLDLGAIVGGYCSDNRRYAFTGELPSHVRETYDTMVSIVDDVGAMLVPGTTHAEIFDRALALHDERGVAPLARFTHTGHNIGLETEERWLADGREETIEAGMVINIELYTMLDGLGQIGDEESYVIGPDGPERISVLPREIREIR